VVHRPSFIRDLTYSCIARDDLFQFGRPEFIIYIPAKEYERLSSVPGMASRVYHSGSIISQILFDLELLEHVPAKLFYPWPTVGKRKVWSDAEMVLIRYAPKANPAIPDAELTNFQFFLRHGCHSKKRQLVQQLEEWVPGCGPRLIALGHRVFTSLRDLSPAQLLEVFLEFRSWPEYPGCSFHAAAAAGGRDVDEGPEALHDSELLEDGDHPDDGQDRDQPRDQDQDQPRDRDWDQDQQRDQDQDQDQQRDRVLHRGVRISPEESEHSEPDR